MVILRDERMLEPTKPKRGSYCLAIASMLMQSMRKLRVKDRTMLFEDGYLL